jgi:hypothetical protein
MKRRDFLTGILGAAALTPIALAGCGKSDDETGTTGTTDTTDTGGATTDTGGGTTDTGGGTTDTGGGTTDTDTTDTGCEGEASGPSDSHGHNLTIPAADVAAGAPKSYATTGGSHDHTVDVSSADMAKLANCETLVLNSTDGHPHSWTVSI